MATKAKKATKKNPQDATLRNNRARKREIAELQALVDDTIVNVGNLTKRVKALEEKAAQAGSIQNA